MKPIDRQLADRLAVAFAAALNVPADQVDPAVRPSTDPKFGDYQSNAAMALAKKAKLNPRALAEQVVKAAQLDDLCQPPEIAGPGFVNLRLRPEFVSRLAGELLGDERLGVERPVRPESIVIDYSSPNISKEMHIGHLRSTALGDALARTFEFVGHAVHRQNHVGDWGTGFGMLAAYLHGQQDQSAEAALSDLEVFYKKAKELFDGDPGFKALAHEFVLKLQGGDEAVLSLWRKIVSTSIAHCQAMYGRMNVTLTPEHVRGESAYNNDLPHVIDALTAQGLLKESEGAQCVFVDGFINKEGNPLPFIVQKTGGGYLYATTDLAAVRYRVEHFHPDRILYVTDSRQAQHFAYMFAVAKKAGFAPESVQLVFVPFGTIQGPDGKPFKTKSGESVKLADVLGEAEQRAAAIVAQKNPDLPAAEQARVAHVVGVGAVKYFDLSNNRISDYRFDWDQMLALTGNTAPYLQYAYARIRSIFRKGGVSAETLRGAGAGVACEAAFADPNEQMLVKHVARYGETVYRVIEDYRPNVLCDYLYELANRFTGFYENCPVLKADEPMRTHRLMLCQLTSRALAHGLGLLGIEVLEAM